jgi:aldose 1-epimerase
MRAPRAGLVALVALALAGCGEPSGDAMPSPTVTRAPFGTLPDGRAVELFTLANGAGMNVAIMTYGATIVSLETPDRTGRPGDVVLGYDSLAGYLRASPYFGSIVGRYGNRIGGGRFTLDGRTFQLTTNDGPNHLHGGVVGFDKVLWQAEPTATDSSASVAFTYVSPDGEEGYPGTLRARVTYTLDPGNRLTVDYQAATDAPTPVNLTQHSYFNLSGASDILSHQLVLAADRYTPVDSTLIPTGELAPVEGTPFDFRTPTAIGARIAQDDEQLRRGRGYDHNFVLIREGAGLVFSARVTDSTSGRVLEIFTTEPGIQFYSGNFLDGTITGKGGKVYSHRSGFCLETQHFPDSPNQPDFPGTILRPGEEYRSTTVFAFGSN